jgi:hypothetical protein
MHVFHARENAHFDFLIFLNFLNFSEVHLRLFFGLPCGLASPLIDLIAKKC